MENISDDSSFDKVSEPAKEMMKTDEILIDYNEEEEESEFKFNPEEPDTDYQKTHFYALLLFFNNVDLLFKKKNMKREAFEKIMSYSQINKLQDKNLGLQALIMQK